MQKLSIPALIASPTVVAALPSWLRLVCTARFDTATKAAVTFEQSRLAELAILKDQSKADIALYINRRIRLEPALGRVIGDRVILVAERCDGNMLVARCLLDSYSPDTEEEFL